jgi:hypothetical protein
MKLEIPQINWHGSMQRILSLDFHPFFDLLVTGGSDEKRDNDIESDSEAEEEFGYIKVIRFMPN